MKHYKAPMEEARAQQVLPNAFRGSSFIFRKLTCCKRAFNKCNKLFPQKKKCNELRTKAFSIKEMPNWARISEQNKNINGSS